MLDGSLTAQQAVESGFANSIVPELKDEPDWFEIKKVPGLVKLLATDYQTLTNCKRLLNAAKDNKKINETIELEAHGLIDSWEHPDFIEKVMSYVMELMMKKQKNKAKL